MKKNLKLKVEKEDMLFNYLREKLVSESKNNIKSLLSKKHIYVNDNLQTKYDYKLSIGDIISIKTTEIVDSKTNVKINIIYEDEDIIVINKPSGILTIATNKEKELTIYHLVMQYLKSKNKNNKVFIIHRLDKDTSGILIFAKSEKIKKLFQDDWNNIVLERRYYAIVEGNLKNNNGTIKSYLKENKNYIVYSSNDKVNGKLAITDYEVVKTNNKYSLLDINIRTGRKNQIRVHLYDIGKPIIGDKKYGSKINPIGRLALHAYRLKLIDPRNNNELDLYVKIPNDMKKLL